LSSPPWLAQGQGETKKGAPISAPSIHIGALVGVGSFWLKISTKLKIIQFMSKPPNYYNI
jgi:hypothetical protein